MTDMDNLKSITKKRIKFSHFTFITGYIFILYQLILFLFSSNSKVATSASILLLFLLFLFSCISAYKDMKNIMLLLFYICLFNFQFSYFFFGLLLGYDFWIIPDYFGEVVNSSFSVINQVLFLIGLSVIVVHAILIKYHNNYQRKKTRYISHYKIDNVLIYVQKISKLIIIITAPFALLVVYKQMQYVLTYGYQTYFLVSSSDMGVSTILSQIETMFRVSMAMYFATYPNRKQLMVPLTIYIIYTIMYLGVGDRTNVAVLFMMLVWYFSEHKKRYPNTRKKLGPVNISGKIKVLIFGALLLFVFSIWNTIRYSFGTGKSLDLASNSNGIIGFLASQGRSYNTVLKALTIDNESLLSISDRIILFFQPVLSQVEGMSLNLLDWEALRHIAGFSFSKIPSSADLISIFTNSKIYLSGGGLGTSYLAEGVLIAGYFGVLITSVIVAIIIGLASYYSQKSFWTNSFVIFSFVFIMRLPRDFTLGIVGFVLPFMSRAIIIYFVSKLIAEAFSKAKISSKSTINYK